jgi:hypothetical protein
MPYDVFPRAYIDTAVVCIAASQHPKGHLVNTYEFGKRERLTEIRNLAYKQVPQSDWLENEGMRIVLDVQASRLLARLLNASHAVLSDCAEIRRGVLPGAESLSTSPDKRYRYRYFEGDVYRYTINPRFPNFIAFDNSLRERPKEVMVHGAPYPSEALGKPTFSPDGLLHKQRLPYKQEFVFDTTQTRRRSFCSASEALAQHILDLQERLQTIKTDHEKIVLQRQIDATDKQIDQLVYVLYGLTKEEIRIVEEATK